MLMNFKKITKFFRKNSFLLIFIFCIIFVAGAIFLKTFVSKPQYVYVKVKLGQGLWWATTAKSSIWSVDTLNKGDISRDLLGNSQAEILEKRYYRWYLNDQFDVYLTLKLKVSYNKKTGEYTFNRNVLSVNAAMELQFPQAYVSGTVLALSNKPFNDTYTEKTVYLSKRNAYPFEYDAVKIGDTYFDGKDKIFEVLDKTAYDSSYLAVDTSGDVGNAVELRKYIIVKAKIKVKNSNGQWVLGEDQIVTPGKTLILSTQNFQYDNYFVSKIE